MIVFPNEGERAHWPDLEHLLMGVQPVTTNVGWGAVYIFRDEEEHPLYVGETGRTPAHRIEESHRLRDWFEEACPPGEPAQILWMPVGTPDHVRQAIEVNLIHELRPFENWKDNAVMHHVVKARALARMRRANAAALRSPPERRLFKALQLTTELLLPIVAMVILAVVVIRVLLT